MIDYIQKGGLLMWPILACSVVAIAVFAERLFYLHRATIHVGEFLQGVSNLVQRRNFAEALHESAGTPGPVARVIHAAIIHHEAPRTELRQIVQEAGQLEVPKLERFLGVLATLAYLAPLLGLLGTVAERRVRDCYGAFQWRLQEFAHDRSRACRGDADFRRLQLPFFPSEHVDARNGAGGDRSGAYVDGPRADERHHHFPSAG
jgi:hypothetical protein